jgi:predicted transcriptional regulator
MKKLIVSLKTSSQVLDDFKRALKKAKKGEFDKEPHYEISFDNKKDFDRFIRNLYLLSYIIAFRPKSVYELAKIAKMDVSNLNKIILFFEEVGAIKLKTAKVSGRTVKTPVVKYNRVEFNLAA